ncbi:MAG: DUF3604 domain-containing protein [Parahaliea sp.]
MKATLLILTAALLSPGALAQQPASDSDQAAYSPPVRHRDHPHQLLWGDTHLHTNMSADAFMEDNRVVSPETAFRFARGEVVTTDLGEQAALRRPLDFLVVSDHSEYLGLFAGVADSDETVLSSELGKRWRRYYEQNDLPAMFREFQGMVMGTTPDAASSALKANIWSRVAQTADSYNEPGRFSAFIGYEWSSSPQANNLHRVVVYRDGADKAAKMIPFTAVDSNAPSDLWQFLADYEARTGGQILAIPHNGNLSNGLMFAPRTYAGQAIDRRYAENRARWEPIYEVTQIKGDGETHPKLSPSDEFADYETWDTGNFPVRNQEQAKTDEMLPFEYARSALKLGLQLERELRVNPFQFGMIGSTDAHTGLSAVEEDNFFGKFVESEPNPQRLNANMEWLKWPNSMLTSSGLMAAWTRENTRGEIFDAMKRREVYATTGSRIALRFFGGWDFDPLDALRPDHADIGYRKGVPMGGGLGRGPASKAPQFLIMAAKDPDGANLDRVQVVKGWLDAAGQQQEKIYEVALSDSRQVDPATGVAPRLPSTVDIASASYTNSVGAATFALVWEDPDFNPAEPAFYDLRALEILKPRWTAYDARHYRLTPNEGIEMTTQDRAYSSPIWYTP